MSPSEAVFFCSPALPLDDDLRRLLIAQQRFCDARPEPEALHQLLVELAQWVVGCDGALVERLDGDDLVSTNGSGLLAERVGSRVRRERSLSGLAIGTGEPQLSRDLAKDARADAAIYRRLGITSLIAHPLRSAHDPTAVLKVVSAKPEGLTERDVALLHPLVHLAAARLENLAVANERLAAEQLLATVGEGSRAVLAAADPAAELCRWACQLVDAPLAVFLQPDADGNLVTGAQAGATLPVLSLPPGSPSLIRSAFTSGRLLLVPEFREHPDASPRALEVLRGAGLGDMESAAFVPVGPSGQPIGVLALLLRARLTAAHASVLGLVSMLATEAGLAIERDHLTRRLEAQARSDDLTGLPNRRVWQERLALEMARASRTKTPLCLAIFDLDHFKDFNDSHGHQAGDELLHNTARAWAAQIRETDLLARLGGEEFALVLPDTDEAAGCVIGERLLRSMPGEVTASAGLARWRGEEADTLYRRADVALYAAKAAGRDQLTLAAGDQD